MAGRLIQLLAATCLVACACEQPIPPTTVVNLDGRAWTLEIAATPEAIQQGLMNRPDIPVGSGMLFVFEHPTVHRFWMANCLTDIDLIYLDGEGRIVTLHRMTTEPPRGGDESVFAYEQRLPLYSSIVPVRFAIELPPGSINTLGLRRGQKVQMNLDELRGLVN